MKQDSTVISGDMGVNIAGPGPFLTNGVELTIGDSVNLGSPNIRIMGDSVKVKQGARVYDVHTNDLSGNGHVLGQVFTPLELPLVSSLPALAPVNPGTQDFDVRQGGSLSLNGGQYGLLKARLNATITLTGGEYHFTEWDVGQNVTVQIEAPVDIRIAGRLAVDQGSTIIPASHANTLTAQDIMILVTGINGSTGNLGGTPKAAKFGIGTTVRAKVYAPNGTIWLRQNSTNTGAFLGKWVILGNGAIATFEGGHGLHPGNTPPVAKAGPDQTVQVTDTVQVNASGSTDTDGNLLTFGWSFLSIPPGSSATLSDPTAVIPTFIVDQPGTYEAQLIVNDGTVDSAPDTVLISTDNSPPVANAGPDQTVFVTEGVVLDGTNSHDVDHDPLTYLWNLNSAPTGSTATLSEPTSPTPGFTVDRPGAYSVDLIVKDGRVDSAPDQVVINTINSLPVAEPGPDQTVSPGTTVQLDGSGSGDTDNDPLTYFWSFTTVPAGSDAMLSDSNIAHPTFVADRLGLFVVQLIVNDATVNSTPETVVITVLNPPVANAGREQTVTVGTIVALDGTGSSDPEGDPLTFQWALTSHPTGSTATILNPTFASPTIVPDLPGSYVVSLVVTDGVLHSVPDTVVITAQAFPPPPVLGLILTNPPDGAVVSFSPISVSGLVSDPSATITVNGVSASVTDGIFVADGIGLQEGLNTITVIANDGIGNTNSLMVPVTFTPTATAHMNPILGPVEWVKHNTGTEVFTAEFANCELSAQYQLVITNGTSSGINRVSSGTVLLNGVEVIGPQELTAAAGQIIKPIIAQSTNELVAQLQGDSGAQVQAVIDCTGNCLAVTIDSPVGGATVNELEMVVQGTVITSSESPVGVIVNQQAAKVAGTAFAIDRVAVRDGTGTPGPTTVIAHVTNACEHRASTAIQVHTTQTPNNQVQLRATPDRDVAPSEVTLRVSTDLDHPVAMITWDYEGDGAIEVQGPDLFEQSVTYTQAGIQLPRVLVTDDQGATFEASAVVLVEDTSAFEARLNATWSGMMDALAQGNIEQALSNILTRKREVMRHDWTVLKDHLGDLAEIFDVPLHLTDGQGLRVIAHNPTPLILGTVEFPLEVEFVLDTDGQWRIRSF